MPLDEIHNLIGYMNRLQEESLGEEEGPEEKAGMISPVRASTRCVEMEENLHGMNKKVSTGTYHDIERIIRGLAAWAPRWVLTDNGLTDSPEERPTE